MPVGIEDVLPAGLAGVVGVWVGVDPVGAGPGVMGADAVGAGVGSVGSEVGVVGVGVAGCVGLEPASPPAWWWW
ncbi:hypothetical protein BIU96_08195 [Curtobacterium sp. MCBA15_008]|nr:hypothetical protein BIU96_08195 [Curtobacterium sp. MCBA15_008]